MAAMIAMPVVAFVLLMTMALYEDRMLPRGEAAADPSDREPGEAAPAASAPRPAFGLVTDPRLSRRPNCRVRHADARPVRRSHAPAAQRAGQGSAAAGPGPRTEPAGPAEIPDTVPYAVPDPIPDAPAEPA